MSSILPSVMNDTNSHVHSQGHFWAASLYLYAYRHVFFSCIYSRQKLKRQSLSLKNILSSELIWPMLTNSSSSLTTLILAHRPAEGDQGHQELPASPSFPEALLTEQLAHCYLINNFWEHNIKKIIYHISGNVGGEEVFLYKISQKKSSELLDWSP